MGVFVSILVEIGWGTDPASFMNLNIASTLNWRLGNTEVLVYGLMLIFTIIFVSEMIGFGTLANMILIGYVIDICRFIWKNIGFAELLSNGSFSIRLTVFIATLVLFVQVKNRDCQKSCSCRLLRRLLLSCAFSAARRAVFDECASDFFAKAQIEKMGVSASAFSSCRLAFD
ncbi:hypothetical protein [Treponema zioleckii]|uniref:hypothetical protein n=1 Tax=Treponema zioleckii TaxID=331680 RepID=UPI00168BCD71|nr:hypothetical protein [Treponema zioleckii]